MFCKYVDRHSIAFILQSMKPTRREHIIPKMLLRRFADDDGLLWVYEKGKEPRRSKPERECVERDFFEFEVRGRKTNNHYEKWLSALEALASQMLSAVMERRSIAQRDAVGWAIFVGALFGRSRKVRSQVSNAIAKRVLREMERGDFIRDAQVELLKQGRFYYAEDLQRTFEELHQAMSESPSYYHVTGLPNRAKIVAESLLARDWHTLEVPADHYFLFSDCPVITVEIVNGQPHPGVGFGKENAIVVLPISPSHLFVASPPHLGWKSIATIPFIASVNQLIVHFAHRNVYSNINSEWIKHLVDVEIDTIVFGENAFVPPMR